MVNAGSRHEPDKKAGLAHFIEHVIFKGTEKRNAYQVLNRLESVGGDLNAYTTKEETCVHASMLHIHFDRAVELLADIIFSPSFPAKEVIMLIPQAAAHGITLTRADTVVWWGPIASAELYMQGNARAHRAGQKHSVTVVRLQGSPVEKRIYSLLDGKVDLHQGLVELYEQEIA